MNGRGRFLFYGKEKSNWLRAKKREDMFCRHCGKELPEGAQFCPSCGNAAPSAESGTGAQSAQQGNGQNGYNGGSGGYYGFNGYGGGPQLTAAQAGSTDEAYLI